MARPKEFDADQVLSAAMQVFWNQGYEATTTDDLVRAMGIGKQSMYDTFGDKQRLYLAALRRYHEQSTPRLNEGMPRKATPLAVLSALLVEFSRRDAAELSRGCMGINATVSFGLTEPEVLTMAKQTARRCEDMFSALLREAQEQGQLPATLEPQRAARFLYTLLQGLTVRAQAGASAAALDDAAKFAVAALQAGA